MSQKHLRVARRYRNPSKASRPVHQATELESVPQKPGLPARELHSSAAPEPPNNTRV